VTYNLCGCDEFGLSQGIQERAWTFKSAGGFQTTSQSPTISGWGCVMFLNANFFDKMAKVLNVNYQGPMC
jgi:hypothetical protein